MKYKDFNWKDVTEDPKVVYNGLVAVKNNPDDFFIMVKGTYLGKFLFGVNDTSKPYVEFVNKIKDLKIPKGKDVQFEYNGDLYNTLPGTVTIYQLKNGSLVWEY